MVKNYFAILSLFFGTDCMCITTFGAINYGSNYVHARNFHLEYANKYFLQADYLYQIKQ